MNLPAAPLAGASAARRVTFFAVEREARWRIWALFGLLVVVVWICLAPLSLLLVTILHLEQRGESFSVAYWAYPGLRPATGVQVLGEFVLVSGVLGVVVAGVAWVGSRVSARSRLFKALGATLPDPVDTYHHRFANIVDELRIAAGLKRLDAVVIRALNVNAVSFAGSRGDACVGVTEGAVSRLSRPQLQAVVAHEVAHVASRDCSVATRASLLFLGVRRIADTYGRGVTIAMLVGYPVICLVGIVPFAPLQIGIFWGVVALLVWTAVWLSFWMASAGASVVDLALSRQREWAADAAAVRFTGDPVSLAEALQMVEWQKGDVPAVPASLSRLAIAPAGPTGASGWQRWFETHPPLEERIARLRELADKQGQTMWERRVDVERRVEAREHAVPAHAGRGRTDRLVAAAAAAAVCPHCGGTLHEMVYEGSAIIECPVCGGVGATRPQVEAILARRDWGFTPEQERVADMIERYQASLLQPDGQGGRRPRLSLPWPTEASESSCCPFCETPMRRAPWSLAYPLPTDFCGPCDLHWFGHDEIEVLQILVERQID